jgi:hypothetical protein
MLSRARRALVLGIGGGGDVAGALTTARLCESLGAEIVMGGVAWERLPIDPRPGPRPAEEIVGGQPLAEGVVVAGPDTRTPQGATFAEAHMARFLGRDVLLLDILGGPKSVEKGLADAARALGTELMVFVDVGGDVLGEGSEPGLASPLCDAVMLAAAARLERRGFPVLGGVFGPCCDGELTIEELLARLAEIAAAGGLVGACGMTDDVTDELESVTRIIPTEASAQAIRCARGETGVTTIRRGRRTVTLSPLGAMTFYFDPAIAVGGPARLANAVVEAGSLEEANEILRSRAVTTELDFERAFTEA